MKWCQGIYKFYAGMEPPGKLPNGIEWLYPQKDKEVMKIVNAFLNKFYNDATSRRLMLGINPGRFGAGVTGVNFTAPRQLVEHCQIPYPYKMQSELSAEFIYDMINAYGGPQTFYSHYFISSVCPLGFVKEGKNINYYDDKELLKAVEPFVISCMQQLLKLPFDTSVVYCIGGEKNYKYLAQLNKEHHWFQQIVSLPHPRFIMQYKRKLKDEYVEMYVRELRMNN